jgi:hypothetical protein
MNTNSGNDINKKDIINDNLDFNSSPFNFDDAIKSQTQTNTQYLSQ